MAVPNDVLNLEPGIYEITYDGCKYRVVIGETIPGNPIGITVHGGGAGGGYKDTLPEQRALLGGVTIKEALDGDNYSITGTNQIDIFPLDFEGYYNWPNGKMRATKLVTKIAKSVDKNFGNPIVYMPEGHSATSRGAIENAMLYAKNGGPAEQIIAFSLEPAHDKSVEYTKSDARFMKEHNIIVLQVRGNSMCGDMTTAIERGMPFIDVDIDAYYSDGSKVTDFWVNHGLARHLMGKYDYADIANGTFSWVAALGKRSNGDYQTFKYDGIKYTIKATVKVYNIDGFKNGEKVSLSELENYMNSLVMSDEEYLEFEISNMKNLVSKVKGFLAVSNLSCDYSTTIIPVDAIAALNALVVLNNSAIDKVEKAVSLIDKARDSYVITDRDLALKVQEELAGLDITTPEVKKDESIDLKEEEPPEKKRRNGYPGNPSSDGDKGNDGNKNGDGTPDDTDQNDGSDKSKEDGSAKIGEDETSDPVISDEDSHGEPISGGDATASEGVVNPRVSDDSYVEKVGSTITPPKNKPKTEIPSKAKTKFKKSTSHEVNVGPNEDMIIEPPVEEPLDEPIDVPIDENYVEVEPVVEPPTQPEVVVPVETIKENNDMKKDSNILKTIGIAAGVGAGIGAVAYGVNEQIRKKETEDGYDYSYSSGTEKSAFTEKEIENNIYSPYAQVQTVSEGSNGGGSNDQG